MEWGEFMLYRVSMASREGSARSWELLGREVSAVFGRVE
jgi:hypothetical protein